MNHILPQVSIIMATYNRAHLIVETLISIQNQSFINWECLIIDDGSTDNTEEAIHPFLRKDQRFKLFKRTEQHLKGLPGCRNLGLELARGTLVVFFDDDDIVHPDNLKVVTDTFENHDVDYVRYLRKVFSGKFISNFDMSPVYITKKLAINDLEDIIMGVIPFNSCQVVWKKKCFDHNLFNESLQYAEEWECYTRILSDGAIGLSVEKVLFYGRKHPKSNTGEFWNNDSFRMSSKIEAVKLVINNLEEKGLLSSTLRKYFIRLGFLFKQQVIIDYTLLKSKANILEILKFKLGYIFYPFIKPIFNWKSKLKKIENFNLFWDQT